MKTIKILNENLQRSIFRCTVLIEKLNFNKKMICLEIINIYKKYKRKNQIFG